MRDERDDEAGEQDAPDPAATRYELLAGLQVADVATTWVILTYASTRAEGNPVVAFIIDEVGIDQAMAGLLVLKLGLVYQLWRKRTRVRLVSAIYAAVVFNNVLALVLWLT